MANRNKITHYNCPECKGAGEYFAEYIAEYPRYEDCGVCEGTGLLNKTEFFRWLGILSAEARWKKMGGSFNRTCVIRGDYRD